MRDEFSPSVKQVIAQRAGHRCSNPACGATTSGPQEDPAKAVNLGVAAHVSAASPGGPRYRTEVSQQYRKSAENGIWLCQNCAKLADNDVTRFTEELLLHWKKNAEDRAGREIGRQSPFDRSAAPLLEILTASALRLASTLPQPLSVEAMPDILSLLPGQSNVAGQVELLASGMGAMGQRFAIIGTGTNHGWNWNVRLSTGGEFGWEPVANISLEGQKSWTPEAAYVPGTPGAIVLTHVHGYGTGVFRRSTSWYRIEKGQLSPFLSYPHEFYVIGWDMPFGRKLTCTKEIMPSELNRGAALDVQFTITYTMEDYSTPEGSEKVLLTSTEDLSLQWNDAAGVFVPRTASNDFARIEEIWAEGTEGFVKRNEERLRDLVRNGTLKQRRFIREHFIL